MKTKLCRKCNLEKNIENFRLKKDKNGKYYRYSYCKECEKIELKKYRKNNYKKYYEKNKEKIKEKNKLYRENNKEKISKYYNNEYMKKWRENNPDKLKEYSKKNNENIKKDEFLLMKRRIRDTIRNGFRRKKYAKNSKTEKILGCDYDFFINYLLKTFKNNYGYEWDMNEKVEIDHIIPLSIAKSESDLIKLSHYTNLQLLKAEDNLKKSNKLNWELK